MIEEEIIDANAGNVHVSLPRNIKSIVIAKKLIEILELQIDEDVEPSEEAKVHAEKFVKEVNEELFKNSEKVEVKEAKPFTVKYGAEDPVEEDPEIIYTAIRELSEEKRFQLEEDIVKLYDQLQKDDLLSYKGLIPVKRLTGLASKYHLDAKVIYDRVRNLKYSWDKPPKKWKKVSKVKNYEMPKEKVTSLLTELRAIPEKDFPSTIFYLHNIKIDSSLNKEAMLFSAIDQMIDIPMKIDQITLDWYYKMKESGMKW